MAPGDESKSDRERERERETGGIMTNDAWKVACGLSSGI